MPNLGRYIFSSLLLLGALYISAQSISQSAESQSLIIETNGSFDLNKWAQSHTKEVISVRPIFEKLNYWRVDYTASKSLSTSSLKNKLQKTKGIINAYPDPKVSTRMRPNDPMYIDQWSKSLIEIERIWEITTGGTTVDGQEIVVAVIDDGFELSHIDLIDNIWTNKGEIDDNGIDDDDNGYVDDVFGLHLPSQTDDHIVNSHGMGVSGIIGASGNNNEGVAGVNWQIKMMLMSLLRTQGSSGGSVSDVIEGLGYALEQREKYNKTNGEEGAFVVAVNWSGGVREKFPRDIPMWCSVYDELGKVGIINVQAVPNENVNIEAVGDMPSLCDSEFMLTVTNTDIADRKIDDAGFGNVSVDMGAPGEDALSLSTSNRYAPFNGTSSATPQVAGVAALLYSLPCSNLLMTAKEDPAAAAREIKRAILDGVVQIPDLQGITVTGGRLNAYNAFLELEKAAPVIENCPDDVTLREDETTFAWDSITVSDDCGAVIVQSDFANGSEFRIGTTEVTITAQDLLNNTDECKFTITREGDTDKEVEFVEVGATTFMPNTNSFIITFETGSFETHIIDIYNMTGQLLRHELYVPTSSSFNTVELKNINFATGTYFIVLSKAGGGIRDTKPFAVVNSQ